MLICGSENFKKIEKLLLLTLINSDDLKKALVGYYCFGIKSDKINKSNFRRAVLKLERVNKLVNEIKELDNE